MRPVREQLEHDRVIRLLQAKYKRKGDVAINPGQEQIAPVGPPAAPWYPDLVLHRGKKLAGVVEVETAESLNHLEAMSQWAAFARFKVPFHLYVPTSGIETARRLCAALPIAPSEIWAYQAIGDQIRFAVVVRSSSAGERARGERSVARAISAESRTARSRSTRRASGGSKSRAASSKAKTARSPRRPSAGRSARRTAGAARSQKRRSR